MTLRIEARRASKGIWGDAQFRCLVAAATGLRSMQL
jgi:hypothetical protein